MLRLLRSTAQLRLPPLETSPLKRNLLTRSVGLQSPFDRSATNTGFDDRVEFTSLDRKGYDEVAGKRPLRALRSSAEWRGVVQGRVVANLRPDNEAFDWFWDRRLDGKSDGQRTVGRRSAADRRPRYQA